MMVSVIIPNYNHALYLEQRINSILEQTYSNFELIILDDNSTDNSREIIEKYRSNPKISHIVYNNENSGSTFKQWEKGIELAKGEYIWIAESDDFANPELLEVLMKKITSDKNISLAYCQSYKVNQDNIVTGNWLEYTKNLDEKFFTQDFFLNGNQFIIRFLINRNVVPNASAVIFKKDNYFRVGGVDLDVKYCADWLFWIKMLTIGDVAFSPVSMNYFRYHQKSVIASASKTSKVVINKKYDILMRFVLHKYLNKIQAKKIAQINKSYISEEALIESFLNLSVDNFFLSLKYLYWGILYSSDKRGIVKRGLKKILGK